MWVYIILFSAFFIIIAIVFAGYVNDKLRKTEEMLNSARQDEKLINLYREIEDMLDSFEEYVSEVHDEFERERARVMEINRQASSLYIQAADRFTFPAEQHVSSPAISIPEKPKVKNARLSDKDRETVGAMGTKPQKVRFLMSRGLSLDEVARELDIGKGEVKLIANLDR